MRLAGNLLLALASTIVFVGALEFGARRLGLNTGFFLSPSSQNCLQRDASTLMRFRPHCTADSHGTPLRTNGLGFRGPEVRDDSSVRIFALGDSCTWGWQVTEEESYPAVLQRVLDERLGAGRYQVINAGTPGYTSFQGLAAFRERGLPLHPKIVIVGFGFNEAARLGDVEQQVANTRRWLPLIELDDWLLEYSTLYRWARWQVNPPNRTDLPVRATPEQYTRNLTEIIRLARESGAHVVLVSFAHTGALQTFYLEAVAKLAEEQHVPYVPYDGPRIDFVHPTASGYRLFVDILYDRLRREGYVSAP